MGFFDWLFGGKKQLVKEHTRRPPRKRHDRRTPRNVNVSSYRRRKPK